MRPLPKDDLVHAQAFTSAERAAVYRAIETRRDVRDQFLPDPLPDDLVARLLGAAHRAPSVGFMQPWNFIVIRDPARRERIRDLFLAARQEELPHIAAERRDLSAYDPERAASLKKELEAWLATATSR